MAGEGRLDPRGPNKFEPGTKAKPAPGAVPGRYTGKERRDDAAEAARKKAEAERKKK